MFFNQSRLVFHCKSHILGFKFRTNSLLSEVKDERKWKTKGDCVNNTVRMLCRNALPMKETHSDVDALLFASQCSQFVQFSPELSPCFLEALSSALLQRGVSLLWGGRSVTSRRDRLGFIHFVAQIFHVATKNKSHRDLLCCIARNKAIWACLVSVLAEDEHNFQLCFGVEMELVMYMIPFISGQSAIGLLVESNFLKCLTLLMLHYRSHIVCLSAQTLTTLLLGKQRDRVFTKLLSEHTLLHVIQRVFKRYLNEAPIYFRDCTCSKDEFGRLSRVLAIHEVLKVYLVL